MAPDRERSRELMAQARRLMPGGVNSPVRAFGAVGGDPPFIERGSGGEARQITRMGALET